MKTLHLDIGVEAHTGLVRERQEDAHLMLPALSLVAVADGMGGHLAGDVASGLAVDALRDHFDRQGTQPRGIGALLRRLGVGGYPGDALVDAVRLANRRVMAAARRDVSLRGMGTTLVVAWLCGDTLHYAHVGDSRIYHCRGGVLRQLTEDHSLVNEYLRRGALSEAEIDGFPYKNVIVRAIGLAAGVEVDVGRLEMHHDDRILLCSDGLTDLVDDARIRDTLASGDDPGAIAKSLVSQALKAGGVDNVTALVARTRALPPETSEVKDDQVSLVPAAAQSAVPVDGGGG